MAKTHCVICSKDLGIFSGKVKISNGAVCTNCLGSAGISALSNPETFNSESIKILIESRIDVVKNFKKTKSVDNYIKIDENNKAFKIGKDIFTYENLLSFELLENGDSVTKGGLGRSVAGGLLFGGVGAVVGGVTGKKKTKSTCTSMKLRVSLKNAHTDMVYINFIMTETKTNSFMYKTAQNSAQKCITALELINEYNQNIQPQSTQSISSADEIIKFKSLLDQGIITQEEFDAKKKNLLDI